MQQKNRATNEETSLGSLPLFLSLFILLLAFFIYLNSISSVELGRSDKVLESLRSSFPARFAGGTGMGVLDSDPDRTISDEARKRLELVFDGALPFQADESDPWGNPVFATLPVDSLFPPGSFEPRPAMVARLGKLADVLRTPGPGRRLDVELLFGYAESGMIVGGTRDGRLRVLRASRLAQVLVAAGAPPHVVAIGVEAGSPEEMRVVVRAGLTWTNRPESVR
jgi:hypothetical protein